MCMQAASQLGIGGSKTKLVIGNNVQGATYSITGQARHVQSFRHNPLSYKRGITVNKNGK